MPLFKDMPFKNKKTKSLNLKNEILQRAVPSTNNNRNSFTAFIEAPPSRKLSRSSSYADNEAVLLNAVAREDTSSVRRLLETGKVDVNVIRNGLSPLHHASMNGNMNIVKMLIEYTANINLQTKEGKSSIKLAVLHGHFELAEYLISLGGKDTDIIDGVQ